MIGIGCVLVGLVACARPPSADEPGETPTWRPVLLAIVAAIAFGGVLVCLADAGRGSASMSVLVMRLTSLTLISGAALIKGGLASPQRSVNPSLVAIGIFDFAANGCYAIAGRAGALPIIGVLGSLYPAVTILLARRIDGERLGGTRGFGVIVTLTGVAFIGATQVTT
ncbi:MAG TPA: EamA family transporter [Frankiaceae bacterium]|nr:EamA family transporter [Frankiaceae bacterium]